jgi:hypothetical protein
MVLAAAAVGIVVVILQEGKFSRRGRDSS